MVNVIFNYCWHLLQKKDKVNEKFVQKVIIHSKESLDRNKKQEAFYGAFVNITKESLAFHQSSEKVDALVYFLGCIVILVGSGQIVGDNYT